MSSFLLNALVVSTIFVSGTFLTASAFEYIFKGD